MFCTFTLVLSVVHVQCPVFLFSVLPGFCALQTWCFSGHCYFCYRCSFRSLCKLCFWRKVLYYLFVYLFIYLFIYSDVTAV